MASSSEEEQECAHCHWECSRLDEELELKKNRIIEAVERNDISVLQTLLDSPELYNIRDDFGYTLLQVAILRNIEDDAFDYLLSLEDYPFDAINDRGETALVTTLCNTVRRIFFNGDYFAFRLIEKGADIHRVCYEGNTLLHCAFQKEYIDIATLLVEKGIKINRQNYDGDTALHMCCICCSDEELVEGVNMLLSYGADPTIRNGKGHTAFDYVIIKRATRDVARATESLFFYLFDDYTEYDIDAEILLKAATARSPFFEKLLNYIGKIVIKDSIKYRCRDLFIMKPKYLQIFIEKFDFLISEILKKTSELLTFLHNSRLISVENFFILAESKLQSEFIEWLCNVNISGVVANCIEYRRPEIIIQELVCFLLSYGMTIRTGDLHLIFQKFGFCELFKILLHMDVTVTFSDDTKDVMPRLLYDFNTDAHKLIEDPLMLTLKDLRQILPYYAIPKLKYINLEMLKKHKDVREKVESQPEIPLLVEMARNVFRKYFVQRLNIANARQFYTQLKLLPISDYHRKIISLEVKLY